MGSIEIPNVGPTFKAVLEKLFYTFARRWGKLSFGPSSRRWTSPAAIELIPEGWI
jgi:hypothetical protein